jgi:endoglucanase
MHTPMLAPSALTRTPPVRALATITLACLVLAVAAGPALAGRANQGVPGAPRANPLAGIRWGVYSGPSDNSVYPYYQRATGRQRRLLAKIALRPLTFWFGAWFPDDQAGAAVRQFIANVTGGNPNVLSQVAVFRLDPWEARACPNGSWDAAAQTSYRTWIANFAAGIGSSRVALVLQPDIPFAVCAGSRVPLQLISYAARTFSALPHTTVYIDAGARYWPAFRQVVGMLGAAGIRSARGFALNTTEYDSTGAEVEYGARIARALAGAGIRGKHFVLNTAENGVPFLNGEYPGNVDNARVCRNFRDALCATLGIPPTTAVASPRWRLSARDRGLAARYADAYLWIGRPWLDHGSAPFDLRRALGLAASTRW